MWSAEDYSDTVSRESIDLVSGLLEVGEEYLVGSAEALCLATLIRMGYYPENLVLGYQHGMIQHMTMEEEIPSSWFSVGINPETGRWHWSILATGDPMFPVDLRGERNDREMSKLRHDLVAMSMGKARTDVKIGDIFTDAKITPDFERFTPDLHVRISNCDFIIEIGTTMATDVRGGLDAFKNKFRKYQSILEEVDSPRPCIMIILIVGRGFVVSNHELDIDFVERLVFYMHIGCRMEETIEASGMPLIMASCDTEREYMTKLLEKTLASIKLEKRPEKLDSVLDITTDFIDSLETEIDSGLVCKYFLRSITGAVSTMIAQSESKGAKGKEGAESPHDGKDSKSEEEEKGDPRVNKYLKILRTQDSRDALKPCTGFPCVSVERNRNFDAEVKSQFISDSHQEKPILKLWNGAFDGYVNYDHDFKAKQQRHFLEAFCLDPEEQERIEKRNKEFRPTAHRCTITGILNEREREVLALDGLWGKRFKESADKKFKQMMAKKPFSLNTDTTDIDAFLSNTEIYKECRTGEIVLDSLDLLRDSMARLGQDRITYNWTREWVNTRIFSALEFISDVAIEIAVSMKQNVSANQIILKKLGFYNVYLLILPTKSSEHIFYSMYFPPETKVDILVGSPFREMIKLDNGGYYTEFWSMRADTIANPSTISSTFLGLVSYWAYHYKLDEFTPSHFLKNLNATTMLNFSLLVRLENKAKTEEIITLSRYMYMEIFKGNTINKPDPFRLVSKMNTCPRSRLELYIIINLIGAFETMLTNLPHRVMPDADDGLEDDVGEEIRNNDIWVGLLNPYTHCYEPSASKLVSSFYIGFTVDKDKIAQANSDYGTIKKAVSKDREFDYDEYFLSNGEKDTFTGFPKEKQFSINAMKHGVGLMAADMANRHGVDFKRKTAEKVLNLMVEKMTEEVATLKASSAEELKPWADLPKAQDSILHKKCRKKVIVALMEKLELFENNVFKNFDQVVCLIEKSSRGVLADLFKKNQHGGLREIYVLEILGRIVALYLECCARILCREFECETMTHPNMKIEVIEAHKIKIATRCSYTDREFSEFHCSADKKSWNNNLVMPALAVALFTLLPSGMHGAIQRCLNMWNKRLLKIPDGVLHLLVNSIPLSDEVYTKLLHEYEHPPKTDKDGNYIETAKGKPPPLLANTKSAFLRLTTGMMQGILHYTSSLAHVAFLYSSADLMRAFIETHCPGSEHRISQMCSSDDSATIISILHSPGASDSEKLRNNIWGEVICLALTTFCSFYCFTNSEKSVMGAPFHIEFNSEFVIGNTVAMPVLKWTIACFGISEAESFLLRYNTMYNLMSQANSSGLPARNTTMVQLAQGLMAYKLIGSSVSPYFKTYCDKIKEYPHPLYGYFIIDNVYVPGMLGFGFHYWATVKPGGLYLIKSSSVDKGILGFTPDGGLVENFLLRHGGSSRYLNMLKAMVGETGIEELRQKVNANAECLYRPSRNTEEAGIKLIAKALLPGTAQSLTKGNPFIQALTSSIYCLQTYCFTQYESCMIGTKKERMSARFSLLGGLQAKLDEGIGPIQDHIACSEAAAFPDHDFYKTCWTVLEAMKEAKMKKVRGMRYKKTVMYIPHATSHVVVPLYDICKDKWVGIRHNHSRLLADKCWNDYRVLMPWLKDNLQDTLEGSPFSDQMELHNFVGTAVKNHRKFQRTGPAIRSTFIESQISLVARKTHQEGYILFLDKETTRKLRPFKSRRSAISLALEIPIASHRSDAIERTLAEHRVTVKELANMQGKNHRESVLNIIVAKRSGYPDAEITRMVMELGGGLLLTWTTAQKKETQVQPITREITSTWTGHGRLLLCNSKVVATVHVKDQEITAIYTNSIRELGRAFFALKGALKSQKLIPSMKKTAAGSYYTHEEILATGPGTPMYENTDPAFCNIPNLDSITYIVKEAQGEMRLVQVGVGHNSSTVLSYKVLPNELDPMPNAAIEDSMWLSWHKQSRMSYPSSIQVVKEAYERVQGETAGPETDPGKEALALKKFIGETLSARLRSKGYLSGTGHYKEDKECRDVTSTEVSLIRSSILCALDAALHQDALNLDRSAREGVDQLVDSALRQQVQDHKLEMEQNPGLEEAIYYDQFDAFDEGTLCLPNFSEYTSLFSGTKTIVEYTTARLTNQYSVLPFWDELIRQVCEINPRAWSHMARGQTLVEIQCSHQLVFFLTGSTPTGYRQTRVVASDEIKYMAKRAIFQTQTGKRPFSRASIKAMDEVARLGHKLANKVREDIEFEIITTKEEMIARTMAYFDAVGRDERDRVSEKEMTERSLSSDESVTDRVFDWVDQVEQEPFEEPVIEPTTHRMDAINGELTINEMEDLYQLVRSQLRMSAWSAMIAPHIVQLRGLGGPFRLNVNEVNFMIIHLGDTSSDSQGAHWVTAVSGMRPGAIEIFDGLNSPMNAELAYNQLRHVFPGLRQDQLVRVNVQPQPASACGHVSALHATHRLLGWPVGSYTREKLNKWVDDCLTEKRIKRFDQEEKE